MTTEQLPRNSLFWILISLFAIIAPHVTRLPPWLLLALVGVCVWRIQVHRGIWSYPTRWVRWLLAFSSIAGLWFSYGAQVSLEPMVALLIFSLMLKLLEMYRHKDVQTVIYLGFFVIATQWLFNAGLLSFIYGILCLFLLLIALLALNLPLEFDINERKIINNKKELASHPLVSQVKTLVWMLLFSLPIMLLLFVFFPKMGALWAVPKIQNQAETGMSDSMSPGDFSALSRRGGRAFTVEFSGSIPQPEYLYWRGMVFSYFDGRTWTRSQWSGQETQAVTVFPDSLLNQSLSSGAQGRVHESTPKNTAEHHLQGGKKAKEIRQLTDYEVTLEPHNQLWLFALPQVLGVPAHIRYTGEWTLLNDHPVHRRTRYFVRSSLTGALKESLSDNKRRRNLFLPEGFNPKTHAIANQWRMEGLNDQAIIQRFLNQIADQFTYTLEPPLLGKHTVDEFLWQTQRGFCEHFASSFVVFMRSAGIPARVVVGYQGGEPVADFWQVTQADAHAWAEIWLEGNGWVRVDPTASVAPERIEHGIREVFERPVLNPLSLEAYQHIPVLNRLRLQMDILNHRWRQQVLNFQAQEQKALVSIIQNYYKQLSIKQFLMAVAILILVVTVAVFYAWWRKRKKIPLALRLLQYWERLMKAKGVVRQENEAIQTFAARAEKEIPSMAGSIQWIARAFDQILYQEDERAIAPLKQYLVGFSRRLRKAKEID